MVLLKYCSSTFQDVSFTLLVTPQNPQQFILMAAEWKKDIQTKEIFFSFMDTLEHWVGVGAVKETHYIQ